MRIAALVESEDHVCCRYRLRAYQPFLASAGYSLELHPLPKGHFDRLLIGQALRDCDLVVVQRKLLSWLELKLLRHRTKQLVYDFDDSIWMRDSYAPKGFQSRRRIRRFAALQSNCDGSIAGNSFLGEHAIVHGARRVTIVPTCLDVDAYPQAKHERPAGSAHLVWIGSSSTLRSLETIRPILESIGQFLPQVKLKLVCDRFLQLDHLPVLPSIWSEQIEKTELAASDIGIAWMPDDPWSRGKCGLKVLQYMAAGLPVIANPVGIHRELIEPGVNGFLVSTTKEWLDAVERLTWDPHLRQTMGDAGRHIAQERYDLVIGAEKWIEFLDELLGIERKRSASRVRLQPSTVSAIPVESFRETA